MFSCILESRKRGCLKINRYVTNLTKKEGSKEIDTIRAKVIQKNQRYLYQDNKLKREEKGE